MDQIKVINDAPEVKKKRKVSKKNKKSWRKHIDITDVENYLEDKRLEERLGGPFGNKRDSELFAVDVKPDVDDVDNSIESKRIRTKAEYRLALRNSEPRCYAILKSTSAVPDPISKRNRVRTMEERKGPVRKYFEELKKARGVVKRKDVLADKNRKLAAMQKASRYKKGEYEEDIWDKDGNSKGAKNLLGSIDAEWLSENTIKHTVAIKGKTKHRVPASVMKKTSVLPAVEPPHPGISYNPSYDDHQSLLHEIAEKEQKLIKEEEHLDRVTRSMFRKVTHKEKEKNQLVEMAEGLDEREIKEEDDEDDGEFKSINPPAKNNKKTRAQRNKQKRQWELMKELEKKKYEKKQATDIYRLKFLDKQIQKKEKQEQLTKKIREKKQAVKSIQPKVLSKTKFEEIDQDFQLGSELSGSLRGTLPSKSLLKDRYKSLQQRNILAPGKLTLKNNKPKVKKYIKSDHKINWPVKNNSK